MQSIAQNQISQENRTQMGYPNFLDLTVLVAALTLPLGLIRMLDVWNTSHLSLLIDMLVYVVILVGSFSVRTLKKLRSPMFLALITVLCLCALHGLAKAYSIDKVAVDVIRPLLFFTTFISVVSAPTALISKQNFSSLSSYLFFVMALIVVAIGLLARSLGAEVYLSLTEISYLIPMAALWFGNYRFAALTLASTLFVGGRRGVLLALIAGLVPLLLRARRTQAILIGVGATAALSLVILATPARETLLSSGTIGRTINELRLAAARSHGQGTSRALEVISRTFDDRAREVTSVLRDTDRSWINAILGNGAGYEYFVESPYVIVTPPFIRGVHASPVGIYVYYGIAGLVLFYGFFAYIIFVSARTLRSSSEPVALICAFYSVAYIANSFVLFSLFISPLFAMTCAIVVRLNQDCRRAS